MRLLRRKHTLLFLWTTFAAVMVGSVYFSFCLFQYQQDKIHKELIEIARTRIEKASVHYNEYIQFLNNQILHAQGDLDKIRNTINRDYDGLIKNPFPKIRHNHFVQDVQNKDPNDAKIASLIQRHQDPFTVISHHYVFADDVEMVGELVTGISFEHLLPEELKARFIKSGGNQISLPGNITGSNSYGFLPPDSSFNTFLEKNYPWMILVPLISLLSIGLGYSASWFTSRQKVRRLRRKSLKLMRTVEQAIENQEAALIASEISKNSLQDEKMLNSFRETLLNDFLSRYKIMASQAVAINTLVSKVMQQEKGQNPILTEIRAIISESTSMIRRIANGHIITMEKQPVKICDLVLKIVDFHIKQIGAAAPTVEVRHQPTDEPKIDKGLLSLILFNLVSQITSGFIRGNRLCIDIETNPELMIRFHDDGYEFEASSKGKVDTLLSLDKNQIRTLVSSIGWSLCFEKENGEAVTTLRVPHQESQPTGNVVPIFDRIHAV